MANIDRLISCLANVKKSGRQQWTACCPAHGDKHPSLSVRELEDGRVLIHCFAGCSVYDVVSAVGLDVSDLFPGPENDAHHRTKPAKPFNAVSVLRCLERDSLTMVQFANKVMRGDVLTHDDYAALIVLTARFQQAGSALDA